MSEIHQRPIDRRLHWEACRNARDLGGLPTSDGGTIRPGALVRADSLGRLTSAGRQAVLDHGVRTVIDVRFPAEAAAEPHPFREGSPDPVLYLHLPVNAGRDPDPDALSAAFAATRTRAEANCLEIDANPVGFARIVAAFAGAPAGGVVIHCQGGKDRTGVAVALLLSLAGVPDEAIVVDYALSSESIDPLAEPPPDVDRPGSDPWWSQPQHYRDCEPEAMLATLAHLRRVHGGAEAYLLRGGATRADLEAARCRLREG